MSQRLWEDIFAHKEWGKYPSENLIRFIARNFYNAFDRNEVKILELGLGTGANLWFCAREGFRVSGIEFTQSGIKRFLQRMSDENLSTQIDTILQGDYFEKLDEFDDESFDAIIDVCSLTCNDFVKTKGVFEKVVAKLKFEGKFYSSTLAEGIFGYEAAKGAWQEPKQGIYTGMGKLRFESKKSLYELYKAPIFHIQSIITSTLEQEDKIIDKVYVVEGIKKRQGGGDNFSPQKRKVGALDEKSAQPFKARTLEDE